jgi:hypothetical protein
MRRNYFALVVFLQLIIVDNSGAAMAQNFNPQSLQIQMEQRTPSLQSQPQTPDFSVRGSIQPNTKRAEHPRHETRQKQHKE